MSDENWHVVTVTHSGQVSIIRNVNESTAKEIKNRLLPNRGPGVYMLSDGTITDVHILGPRQ